MWGPANLLCSDQNQAYIKKNNVLMQKTVTILSKESSVPTMRPYRLSTLSRKLELVPAGLLQHRFHTRSPKAEEGKEEN